MILSEPTTVLVLMLHALASVAGLAAVYAHRPTRASPPARFGSK